MAKIEEADFKHFMDVVMITLKEIRDEIREQTLLLEESLGYEPGEDDEEDDEDEEESVGGTLLDTVKDVVKEAVHEATAGKRKKRG
jgi:hypothetical protein